MIDWCIYLVKSALVFGWLLLPWLLFKRDTFYLRNRLYLLFLPLFSFIIPLISFSTTVSGEESTVSRLLQTVSVTPQKISEQLTQFSFISTLAIIVVLVSAFLLFTRMFQLLHLYSIILKNKKTSAPDRIIIVAGEKIGFSALGYIFISADMNHPSILQHEKIHQSKLHTIDLLFYNILTCLQWFNPLVWVALHHLKLQHEYEADRLTVSCTGNVNEYQALLLSSALGCDVHVLTHSFSGSTLKNRFNMMTKKQSPAWTRVKTLAILPVLAMAVAAFSISCGKAETKTPLKEKTVPLTKEEATAPEFPGGNEAFAKFIIDNTIYPEGSTLEGKVFVSFTVKTDGSISDVMVKRSLAKEFDDEAVRVVKSMPNWKPAEKQRKPVDATLMLPIHFKPKK